MENPNVKKGDEIIVISGRNGVPEGKVLIVVSKISGSLLIKDQETNLQYNIYPNGNPKDEFILANREAKKKYLEEKIIETKKELIIMERDLNILENFETEEAYLAHKISEILKKKDDPRALENLLKELKKTNYL